MPARIEFHIDGLGDFVFRDKTFRDQLTIESQASSTLGRIPDQLRPDELGLGVVAIALAHVVVLGVEFPAGWNPDSLDPVDEDAMEELMTVYRRLAEELARFRAERGKRKISAGP